MEFLYLCRRVENSKVTRSIKLRILLETRTILFVVNYLFFGSTVMHTRKTEKHTPNLQNFRSWHGPKIELFFLSQKRNSNIFLTLVIRTSALPTENGDFPLFTGLFRNIRPGKRNRLNQNYFNRRIKKCRYFSFFFFFDRNIFNEFEIWETQPVNFVTIVPIKKNSLSNFPIQIISIELILFPGCKSKKASR